MRELSVKLGKDYRSFKQGFEYTFKGDLIVISGVNGSGKSQLIDIIHNQTGVYTNLHVIAETKIDGEICDRTKVLYKSFKESISINNLTHAGVEVSSRSKVAVWNHYNQYLLQSSHPECINFSRSCNQAKQILIDKFGKEKFDSKQILLEDVKRKLPNDFIWQADDVFSNAIGEIFYNYAAKVYNGHAQARKGTVFDETKLGNAPWNELNQLFEELGFEYRFKDNYELFDESFELNEQPNLFHLKDDGTLDESLVRHLSELSDGEKAIISFSFASLSGVVKEEKKILLLDEYDATLNPSLTEVFFKILDKYFVSKGIIVVIVTHSPSTISLAPEYTTFYEVFKPKGYRQRVFEVSRESYQDLKKVNKLFFDKIADQDSRIKEIEEENKELKKRHDELEIILKSSSSPLVLTEGKTDLMHLKKAKQVLQIEDEIEFFTPPEGKWGESDLKTTLETLAKIPNSRKVIGIFDRDVPTTLLDIEKNGQEYKEYGNNVYAFCIPIPVDRILYKNISIEFYYSDDELKKEKDGKKLYFDNELYFDNKRNPVYPKPSPADNPDKKICCDNIGDLDWIHSKARFAELVSEDDEFSTGFKFNNFELIFDKIREIISPKAAHAKIEAVAPVTGLNAN